MNALGEALRTRRDELRKRGDTIDKIADRGDLSVSVVYDHLRRRQPYRQVPRPDTLKRLAVGFQMDPDRVWRLAQESTGSAPYTGNPLQLLLVGQRDKLRLTNKAASEAARAKGYSLSRATLTGLMTGRHGQLTSDTVEALAFVFKLPKRQIEEAANQAARRVTYRLPKHLEERLTPDKWDRIVGIVEGILTIEGD